MAARSSTPHRYRRRSPMQERPSQEKGHIMPEVPQPVTDNSLKVRQLTHYQFSWVAGDPGEEGTFTLQLILDQGAWEEVLTVDAEDAEVLQSLLKRQSVVHYDIRRRTLMFGTTPVGN